MTLSPQSMLRDSALTLALLVAASVWLVNGLFAVGVVMSGLVALGNLWLLARLVRRIAKATELGQGGGLAVALLAPKFVFAFAAFGFLMWAFDPLSAVVGMACVPVGTSMGGMFAAAFMPLDELAEES